LTAELALSVTTLVKRFGGATALGGVSFDLRRGEIHALCGENGAGKSTLIKILSGVHPAGSYEGEMRVSGRTATFFDVTDATRAGIAVIHQELALADELSVAENVFLGSMPTRYGLVAWDELHLQARRLFAAFALDLDPSARVGGLGIGRRQLVEIAKALAKNAEILILDEPTAALAEHETQTLLGILRDLRRRGLSAIYVSHRLEEVFSVADRITVLRDGKAVATRVAESTSPDELVRLMVGRELGELYPERRTKPGPLRLEVRGLGVTTDRGARAITDASFTVRAGEVLGVGGLLGAGRSELLLHLFGAFGRRNAGTVTLDGTPYDAPSPRESIRRGLALVTEDRKRLGLVLDASIGFNLSLSSLGRVTRGGLIDASLEHGAHCRIKDAMHIKAAALSAPVATLSGGNQQKVVLGRALMTDPGVFLLDEPTRGVDIGAKADVYRWIKELLEGGCAIVIVSSELEELLALSDRILVLRNGRVAGPFDRRDVTREKLLGAALGSEAAHG
jgi:D-xylose transport system ATP-binding protein